MTIETACVHMPWWAVAATQRELAGAADFIDADEAMRWLLRVDLADPEMLDDFTTQRGLGVGPLLRSFGHRLPTRKPEESVCAHWTEHDYPTCCGHFGPLQK